MQKALHAHATKHEGYSRVLSKHGLKYSPIAAYIGVYSHVFCLGPIAAFRKRGYRTNQINFYFYFFYGTNLLMNLIILCELV